LKRYIESCGQMKSRRRCSVWF